MPRLSPPAVHLSESDQVELEQLVNQHNTPQQLALRARIILAAAAGLNHAQIKAHLQISLDMARLWRKRWLSLVDGELSVSERLHDAERPGAPLRFSPEQQTALFALACEEPIRSGRPISHWTARELADELIKRQIVVSISTRHVGRLLAEADLQPHLIRY